MNKVLVPLQNFNINDTVSVDGARETYIKKLSQYDILPVFVSFHMTPDAIDECYSLTSGLFLMGGSDVDPSRYHAARDPETDRGEPDRERLEIFLVERALKDRRPILGICRGLHVLNVVTGGTLHQHIPRLVTSETHGVSRYGELLTQDKHPVIVDGGSKASTILGKSHGAINSAHHQAVDRPGKPFRVVARSPEEIPEIIEHEDPKYFCFGLQSHPEAEEGGFYEPFFREFVEEVARHAGHMTPVYRTGTRA